jgi:hypothetical protein
MYVCVLELLVLVHVSVYNEFVNVCASSLCMCAQTTYIKECFVHV